MADDDIEVDVPLVNVKADSGADGAEPVRMERDPPSLWGRTLIVGLIFMFVCQAVVLALMFKVSMWAAIPVAILLPFFIQFLGPPLVFCCYGRFTDPNKWRPTVRSIIRWMAFIGGVTMVAAAYFGRDLYYSEHHTLYKDVDASSNNVKKDVGTIASFAGEARAFPNLAGRHLAYGFWPICAAPIMKDFNQRQVYYWAVAMGSCCVKQPVNCPFLDDPHGGYALTYHELYQDVKEAANDAASHADLEVSPKSVYLVYGPPDTLKADLKEKTVYIASGGAGLAFIIGLFVAIKGPY